MDRLTNLPECIIGKILGYLTLSDAIRMGVLSKEWKGKWLTLPDLVLEANDFKGGTGSQVKYSNVFTTFVSQHIGPLLKLHVNMSPNLCSSDQERQEIYESIHLVLRDGTLNKLILSNDIGHPIYSLPLEVFPYARMTYLRIKGNFKFDPPTGAFSGFPNLATLILDSIKCPLDRISSLISNSPKLQRVTLAVYALDEHLYIHGSRLEYINVSGEFKSISLKVPNATKVHLHLQGFNESKYKAAKCTMTMADLFRDMGNVHNLYMGGYMCKILAMGPNVPKKLCTKLKYLATLMISLVDLDDIEEFTSALCVISSLPYLFELKVKIFEEKKAEEEAVFKSAVEKFADCHLNHLRTLEFSYINGTMPQMKMIDFLLGHSPALESMSISLGKGIIDENKSTIRKDVELFRRASPKVDVMMDF